MGGSSQPAGYSMTSGPSIQAAQAAAQAQITAAQEAAQAATENTQSAIQALMGEYSTGLTYANPAVNTGNQAAAQLNYMLGLPAVNPGPAPTAPVAPTLAQAEQYITPGEVNQYIAQNSEFVGNNGYQGAASGDAIDAYIGGLAPGTNAQDGAYAGASILNQGNPTSAALPTVGGQIAYGAMPNYGSNEAAVQAGALYNLAQPQMENLQNQYQNQLTTYNQQLNQWNQQEGVYNTYNALGTATPAEINNIVSNIPGYQFQLQQGTNQVMQTAGQEGLLNSGALLRQLDQFGQGLASGFYNNYLSQLSGLAGYGQQSTQGAVQGASNVGNTAGGLLSALGTDQANAYLSAGQAQASSYLSPAANQQTIMNPYGSVSNAGSYLNAGAGLLGSLSSFF